MIEFWHNPRCSKSRQGLALLQDAGAEVTVRKYLEDAPNRTELAAAHTALGKPPAAQMMRNKDKLFKELGLSRDSSDDILLNAMAEHPALIERPLAQKDGKAVIGRPPEALKALL
ncbi:arsenate reductase (glutaredoxin) [Primorskyibacter sp. S87]|uniref:arsenate reductase (glutaredoxin) n=1 Tax=Primorskyibacter sp. S87 TaxID=3415126 RepID=UPI003C7B9B49